MRVGILTKKIGMTRIFDDNGVHHPVTILECPESVILGDKDNSGKTVRLASFDVREKLVKKPQLAEFKKVSSSAKRYIYEYKVKDNKAYKPGDAVTINNFIVGQQVDVRGKTIGKGFAGAMKRHGFAGLEASHGISVSHRSHGSTGQCQDPGKVFKGKKMAGHMGSVNITVQNLRIIKIDSESNLLFIRGAVPGKKGALIEVKDAVKKNLLNEVPMPAFFKSSEKEVANKEAKKEINKDK
jgi:large subunit ribosomal protein L3